MIEDFEACYRFMRSRDARYDGCFFVGVVSTGIYCRPSCPARLPKRCNVRLFESAAAAQEAGLRACKRCDPDAAPGSPAWDRRADVAGRAFRLIADGEVDREGVPGLARRLGYSERQLQRILAAQVGAGPVALARARRAQSARLLIESTRLPFAEVALAAGFGSVRQFNETIRDVYARTPTEMRSGVRRAVGDGDGAPGAIELRLACRQPSDADSTIGFLCARAVAGIEEVDGNAYRRALSLGHGAGVVELSAEPAAVRCRLWLDDLRDLTAAVARCRRLLDLDADPLSVSDQLGQDPVLGDLVRGRPGLRVPACVDGFELAVRAVIGQQISVAAARTVAGRLVERWGEPLKESIGAITHRFPTSLALAQIDPATLPVPRARAEAIRHLAALVAAGDLSLGAGADRDAASATLLSVPGIGRWTASYIAMRALGDPDAYPRGDLALRRALERRGFTAKGADAEKRLADAWRPWRSYAVIHLWRSLADSLPQPGPHDRVGEPDPIAEDGRLLRVAV
ncbi:MAG TPA: AlkA N-terminal domain-containing protein [Solirubrobacterales bacterium]|nr:AlkA N-terminal domain-containing protein [Solirubrobacterales bacterium]